MYNEKAKFSLWVDFLEREFINSELVELIESGVINGATSNPSIFKNAILNSKAYKESREKFGKKEPKELYEILAVSDIRSACEKFLKNYVSGDEGFVSLEVDPNFSSKIEATLKEGKELHSTIGMPNVMIKIPATKAGYAAMRELIKKGVNVNATLIFSPEQTKNCLEAFKKGIEEFKERFPGANLPRAVISIFVSRFDRLLDDKLKEASITPATVGIYNATKCYNMIEKENLGFVKALFASTGVKGDELKKDYYITELLYPNCINTAPLETIKEFIKNGGEVKTPYNDSEIDEFFARIKSAGIDMNSVYEKLLKDGLKQFVEAFDEIIKSLKKG